MALPRFVIGTGRNGSVCLRDTLRGRLAATIYRDWDQHGYRAEKADAVARAMAEICAEALNRAHEEALRARQQGAAQ